MAKKNWMVTTSELDDKQREIFNAVLDKSCVVSGCAGSGKSVLALLKAQRIQQERGNDSCQVIVYTKALNDFMKKAKDDLKLSSRFLYYEEWLWKKEMKRYGKMGLLPVLLKDENSNKIPNKPSSDYVIIDEIQDFTSSEIQDFLTATNKYFFFFGDTAQSIYDGYKVGGTMRVNSIVPTFFPNGNVKEFTLFYNHRLPIPVAKLAQYIGVNLPTFDEGIYKSQESVLPKMICYKSKKDQLDAINRIISDNDMDDVAILLPKSQEVKNVYENLKIMQKKEHPINYEVKYSVEDTGDDGVVHKEFKDNLNFDSTNPKIMTYHSAKGLQFETVFIPYIEDYYHDGADGSKALYVAMTRTYRNLYIMYTGVLPVPLDKVKPDIYQTTEVETMEEK